MVNHKKDILIRKVSERSFVDIILEFFQKEIDIYFFIQPTIEFLRFIGFLPFNWNKNTKSPSFSFIWAFYDILWIIFKIYTTLFIIIPQFKIKGYEVSNKLLNSTGPKSLAEPSEKYHSTPNCNLT